MKQYLSSFSFDFYSHLTIRPVVRHTKARAMENWWSAEKFFFSIYIAVMGNANIIQLPQTQIHKPVFTTSTNANPQSLHTTFSCANANANANHRGGAGTVSRGAQRITGRGESQSGESEYLFLNQPEEIPCGLPQFVCLRCPHLWILCGTPKS